MLRRLAIPLLAALLLAGLAYSFLSRPGAPEVTFTTLDGRQLSTAQLHGKVTLVNFWATTCSGCIAEMPELVETYQRYHDAGFELIAVAMAYDPPSQVASFVKARSLPFTVALDTQGHVAQAFNDVKLTPTAFVIDKQGRIVSHVVGELDFQALHALLDRELKGAS